MRPPYNKKSIQCSIEPTAGFLLGLQKWRHLEPCGYVQTTSTNDSQYSQLLAPHPDARNVGCSTPPDNDGRKHAVKGGAARQRVLQH
jgi:hypothetical protein